MKSWWKSEKCFTKVGHKNENYKNKSCWKSYQKSDQNLGSKSDKKSDRKSGQKSGQKVDQKVGSKKDEFWRKNPKNRFLSKTSKTAKTRKNPKKGSKKVEKNLQKVPKKDKRGRRFFSLQKVGVIATNNRRGTWSSGSKSGGSAEFAKMRFWGSKV